MASTFFSTASIGSVSTVILFLMTFLPYIIIISLGAVLGTFGKFLASLSFSTAFCYAWHYIFRTELQGRSLSFSDTFSGSFSENDFKFGVTMIIVDTFLYAAVGYFVQRFTKGEKNILQLFSLFLLFISFKTILSSIKWKEEILAMISALKLPK